MTTDAPTMRLSEVVSNRRWDSLPADRGMCNHRLMPDKDRPPAVLKYEPDRTTKADPGLQKNTPPPWDPGSHNDSTPAADPETSYEGEPPHGEPKA